ncbi:MAG: carboxypeptidase-like regulatory domain-containing protein [Gemmatimonadetes bacterium]|nr:carboxypeptidase-like regulatory domain-containing protein [Gemmatimonadota bacterium]
MTGLLALVAGLSLAVQAAPQGSVRGQVREVAGEAPLAGAAVRIVDLDRLTITDEHGHYILSDVPAGEHRIRASIIGHSSLEVVLSVPENGHLAVDFILTTQPVELPPVTAEGVPDPVPDPSALSPEMVPATGTAVVRVLDASPGVSETGIAATALALLASNPPSAENILFVRGSGTALDLVLLDGAPVHSPLQIGGLLDPGLPATVANATRWHGGAPARFDGGLSEVLSLESFGSPEGLPTAVAFVDLVSAGTTFRTGGGPARASFSARSLHGGATGAFVDGAFPQRYADVLTRLDVGMSATDTLMVTGFWNRESVVLPGSRSLDEGPEWGNQAGSIRFRSRSDLGLLEAGVSTGEFRNQLPIGAVDPVLASGTTKRTRVTLDILGDQRRVRYGFGMHLDRLALSTVFAEGPAGQRLEFGQANSAVALAGYFDTGLRVARGLRISAGVRGNLYSGRLGGALSPRARLEWNASENLLMTVSAGQYHQLVVAPDTSVSASAALLASTEAQQLGAVFTTISPAEASHFVVGFSHSAAPGEQLALQGYWKTSSGLPVLGGADLQNAGFDLWLTQPAGRVVIWGNYSMAWAWTELVAGERTDIFSGRHYLRAGAMADLGKGLRFDADIAYGAGLEFGEIPRPGPSNLSAVPGGPASQGGSTASFSTIPGPGPITIPAILVTVPEGQYIRLNLRVTARLDSHLFGRRTSFYPYVRVINALDRADAMFYQFDQAADPTPRAFGAIPILPVIGVEWRM